MGVQIGIFDGSSLGGDTFDRGARCMWVMTLNMYRVCRSMTGRMEPCEAGPLGPVQSEPLSA
jgi:hypothetical protein